MIAFLASNATLIGLLFFFCVFVGIGIWAYLPSNKSCLEKLKNIPLSEPSHD